MKTGPLTSLVLAAGLFLAAGPAARAADATDTATVLALKRVQERYALTKARIASLVGPRMNPVPLAASLPNPFYVATDLPPLEPVAGTPGEIPTLPSEPDETDASTLAKFVTNLRISGLTVLNGRPLLTLNGTLCRAGDSIPVETKDRTVYIQVMSISPDELTLGLNQEKQTVRVRR